MVANLGRSIRQGASGSRQDLGKVLNAFLGGVRNSKLPGAWAGVRVRWRGFQVARKGRVPGGEDNEVGKAGQGGVRIEGRGAVALGLADHFEPEAIGVRVEWAGPAGAVQGRR